MKISEWHVSKFQGFGFSQGQICWNSIVQHIADDVVSGNSLKIFLSAANGTMTKLNTPPVGAWGRLEFPSCGFGGVIVEWTLCKTWFPIAASRAALTCCWLSRIAVDVDVADLLYFCAFDYVSLCSCASIKETLHWLQGTAALLVDLPFRVQTGGEIDNVKCPVTSFCKHL